MPYSRVPVVSWRGDGQYFSVSTVDTLLEQKYRWVNMTIDSLKPDKHQPFSSRIPKYWAFRSTPLRVYHLNDTQLG